MPNSFIADPLGPKDSIADRKYMLLNESGDSLMLFQKLPFQLINGEVIVFEMEVTGQLVYIKKDSCYSITYQKDPRAYNDTGKAMYTKVDFISKERNRKISRSDGSNSYFIHRIEKGSCCF